MVLLQEFPKGCLLQLLHCPQKPPFLDLLRREDSLLWRSVSDPGKGCDDRATNQGLILLLTGQVVFVVPEAVDNHEVPGQPKHGPLDNHHLIPSLDACGDHVKGANGGNSDPLQAEEKGKAEG